MIDFKKALSKERYDFVKGECPDIFNEIVEFSATFGDHETQLWIRAQVEEYCMEIARRMWMEGRRS